MNTKNKALIFLSFFVIPEFFWSPVVTISLNFFIYNYFFRRTIFLSFPNYVMAFIVFLQFIGALFFTLQIFKYVNKEFDLKMIILIFSAILFSFLTLLSVFALLVLLLLGDIGF